MTAAPNTPSNSVLDKLPKHIKDQLKEVPPENRHHFLSTLYEYLATGNPQILHKWSRIPVSPEFFIKDPYFMGAISTVSGHIGEDGKVEYKQQLITPLYPTVLKEFIKVCSHTSPYTPRPEAPDFPVIDELLATGGIGSGKSTLALYCQAYQLYLLSCMVNPQQYYGLDPASELLIVFQAPTGEIAESGDFARFKAMVGNSRYFQENFFPTGMTVSPKGNNLGKGTSLEFPNRVVVKAISSLETGSIGQNVIGGLVEEVNFMGQRLRQDGTKGDHAAVLYEALATRRRTRFTKKALVSDGKEVKPIAYVPGLIAMVSSRVYPEEFTDLKEKEAKVLKNIYVYDKRVWEVKPDDYTGKTFRVFVGDETRRPKVLGEGEVVHPSDAHLVDHVPDEYRMAFDGPRADIVTALRNICGRSVLATTPFIPNRELVEKNFGKRKNVLSLDAIDFVKYLPAVLDSLLKLRPDCPRWASLDLSLTGDSCGLVICHVPGFKEVTLDGSQPTLVQQKDGTTKAGPPNPMKEWLPIFEADLVLEIMPPKGGEILISSARHLIYKLRDRGLPIKYVSYDTFQSAESLQALRQQGFIAGTQSTDTTNEPMKVLKSALYDERMVLPAHAKLRKEILQLEKDPKTGKIDHPPKGSKDIVDALARCAFGLFSRREIWMQYNIPITQTAQAIMAQAKQPKTNLPGQDKPQEVVMPSAK